MTVSRLPLARLVLTCCLFTPLATPALASIWCLGKLSGSYITPAGDLIVNGSWRNDWTRLCNVNTDSMVCPLWASYAATAITNKLKIRLMYSENTYQCSDLPTYNSTPKPAYLMLTDMPAE